VILKQCSADTFLKTKTICLKFQGADVYRIGDRCKQTLSLAGAIRNPRAAMAIAIVTASKN
jgi:hypothetical protein